MGYPRYNNVEKVEGQGMPFETYLKQIRLLYPNLPDLYSQYLQLIYEFNGEQLERMLTLQHHQIGAAILDATIVALQNAKAQNPDAFMAFVEQYQYQDIVAELFEIAGGKSFEEWLEEIKTLYPDATDDYLYYLQLASQFMTDETMSNLFTMEEDPILQDWTYNQLRNDFMLIIQRLDYFLQSESRDYGELSFPNYTSIMIMQLIQTLSLGVTESLNEEMQHYSMMKGLETTASSLTLASTIKDTNLELFEMVTEMFQLREMAKQVFDLGEGGGEMSPYTIEFGTSYLAPVMQFMFETPHANYVSHTHGIVGNTAAGQAISLAGTPIMDEYGYVVGLEVVALYDENTPDLEVSIHAVCWDPPQGGGYE